MASAPEIDASYLKRCVATPERAFALLNQQDADSTMHDVFRAACVKEFELVLEQSGKLLRKRLRPWFASNRQVDRLAFNDIFRYGAKHGLVECAACERWLQYRANRNDTAHNYGEVFAATTLKLLPDFLADAKALSRILEAGQDG